LTKVNLGVKQKNWSTRIKIARVLWLACQFIYWPIFPKMFSPVRIFVARLFGAEIGKGCLISKGVKIWMPWHLKMGDYASLGVNVEVYNFAKVTIGSHSCVSQYSYLCSASHDYTNPIHPLIYKNIHIEDQCWIAAGAFIGPGVTINSGCVIGARAVVTKNTDAWFVYAGNPAVKIKPRQISDAPV